MDEIVNINVGGTKFTTTRTTLKSNPNSLLAAYVVESERERERQCPSYSEVAGTAAEDNSLNFSLPDTDRAFFFDRNPQAFAVILEYLRTGNWWFAGIPNRQVFDEARYFEIRKKVLVVTVELEDDYHPGQRVKLGEPGNIQSTAIALYPGDAPVDSQIQFNEAFNSDWKTGVIGWSSAQRDRLILSFETAGSLPRRVLYTFDVRNEKQRRALKEAKAQGGPDLHYIKKQVLGKFDHYWSTAVSKTVSKPGAEEK